VAEKNWLFVAAQVGLTGFVHHPETLAEADIPANLFRVERLIRGAAF
jgi:hypothetical protein